MAPDVFPPSLGSVEQFPMQYHSHMPLKQQEAQDDINSVKENNDNNEKTHASTLDFRQLFPADTTKDSQYPTNTHYPPKIENIRNDAKQLEQHDDNYEDAHFSTLVRHQITPADPNDRQSFSPDDTNHPINETIGTTHNWTPSLPAQTTNITNPYLL